MKQFFGTIEELHKYVESCGLVGEWQNNEQSGCHTFRARTGEILNWWPSKGTIQFQGKNAEMFKIKLSTATEEVAPTIAKIKSSNGTKKIFIVHGHDREARDQLELVLMRLGLQPFILQNADGGSQTIIEALETNIIGDSAFGIVLMTPDDYGYVKTATDADRQPRARQNVILEMGMIMAALGRSHMAILKKGALEIPSDADGILRIEFNDHVREIVPKLVQRLQAAGFEIDPQKMALASA